MSKLRIAAALAILLAALAAASSVQAHRLHHRSFPTTSKLAFFEAKAKWLARDKHHVDVIRWRQHRVLLRLYGERTSGVVPNLGAAIRWHRAIWHRHNRWFHSDRKAIKWVQRKIAHLQEASAWNSPNLALIPGVPYSFAACVALRESTNGQGSHDYYGILPVSTWAYASLAAQKHQFAYLYAKYGVSPWRPWDGC